APISTRNAWTRGCASARANRRCTNIRTRSSPRTVCTRSARRPTRRACRVLEKKPPPPGDQPAGERRLFAYGTLPENAEFPGFLAAGTFRIDPEASAVCGQASFAFRAVHADGCQIIVQQTDGHAAGRAAIIAFVIHLAPGRDFEEYLGMADAAMGPMFRVIAKPHGLPEHLRSRGNFLCGFLNQPHSQIIKQNLYGFR